MKKWLLTLAGVLIATQVQAASIILNWSVTGTPTNPATHWRVEEQVSGVWGNITGLPNPLVVSAATLTHTVTNRAAGSIYTFRVVPVRNGIDGTPSNQCSTGVLPPDSVVELKCSAQ